MCVWEGFDLTGVGGRGGEYRVRGRLSSQSQAEPRSFQGQDGRGEVGFVYGCRYKNVVLIVVIFHSHLVGIFFSLFVHVYIPIG